MARFKSNGRVCIGTSNPSRTLEIVHNDGAGNVGGMALKNSSLTNKNNRIEFETDFYAAFVVEDCRLLTLYLQSPLRRL